MPATIQTPAPVEPSPNATATHLRHEEFCLPRPGLTEPRVERYVHTDDDPETGRSRPTHDVTRCLECGAANYKPRG